MSVGAHAPQELVAENRLLREELARRPSVEEFERLQAQVAELTEALAKANERIAELLAIAQRKSRSNAATPPAPPQTPPDLGADAREAFENRPIPPELPKRDKKKKGKQRPTGRKSLPEHLPAEEHTVHPECCECCGGTDLETIDEVVEVKLHVVREHQRRRVVHRKTCRCRKCGERTTARSLPAPFERSKVTCDWLAWLIFMKFVLLVPLDRVRRDLASRGVPLAMSFLVSQTERAADLLGPVDGVHWQHLLGGNWMASDATGLKVLVKGLPKAQNGHIEVYRNDATVVFQYEAHKGSEPLVSKLAPFQGVLVTDAEHRHNALYDSGRILEAGCNAHGVRKFEAAAKVQPVLAPEGHRFLSLMYIAEAEAREQGLVGDELRAWRATHIPPLMADLRAWMDAVEPTLLPSDPLAGVIRYYRNHWDALFRFVEHPEIPIDNSISEREFQHIAKLRLNSLFAGSTEGAHRAATLLGITATCRAIGVDPLAYLTWAFERLGTHREVYGLSAAQLTPAAYKAAIGESRGPAP
jgi:transposase